MKTMLPNSLKPPIRSARKKSHACGPCRRLKRKCDLQIPCGTCSKGKSPKIEECLKCPAIPLDDFKEKASPNESFVPVSSNSEISSVSNVCADDKINNTQDENVNKRQNKDDQISHLNKKPHIELVGSQSVTPVASQTTFTPQQESFHQNSTSINLYDQQSQIYQHQLEQQFHNNTQPNNQQPQIQLNPMNNPIPMPYTPQSQSHTYGPITNVEAAYGGPYKPPLPPSFSDSGQQHFNQHFLHPVQQHPHPFLQIGHFIATPSPNKGYSTYQQQQQQPTKIEQSLDQTSKPLVIQPLPIGGFNGSVSTSNLPVATGFTTAQNETEASGLQVHKVLNKTASVDTSVSTPISSQKSKHRMKFSKERNEGQISHKTTLSKSKLNESTKTIDDRTKKRFTNLLPTKIQTKIIVDFYLQNVDYIYHPLHHPSFLSELDQLWENKSSVHIGYLAVLFMVLSLASIHLPHGLINIDAAEVERCQNIWFESSQECSRLNDQTREKGKFNVYTLQFFSLSQLYFYATKRVEKLHDLLSKAVKDAYEMGLHKDDATNPDMLEVEMKRRLWWDICGCDSFFALSLGNKPMINSYESKVPFPVNAPDEDITSDWIKVRSRDIPTYNSFNIYRAHMMKLFNGVFVDSHVEKAGVLEKYPHLEYVKDKIFKGLLAIDIELCDTENSWFFKLDKHGNIPFVKDNRIHFQHHMLHTCICIHRFRIYQNYLSDDVPIAWEIGKSSALSLFKVYRKLREIYDVKNPLFLSQIHQSFTGSVIQSMLLLLTHKLTDIEQIELYKDIDLMLSDLDILSNDVFILKPEVLKESLATLNALKKNLSKNMIELETNEKDIVSNVFGGRKTIDSYFEKCTVSFIIDQSSTSVDSEKSKLDTVTATTSSQSPSTPQSVNTGIKFKCNEQLGIQISDEMIRFSLPKLDQLLLSKKVEESSRNNSASNVILNPVPSMGFDGIESENGTKAISDTTTTAAAATAAATTTTANAITANLITANITGTISQPPTSQVASTSAAQTNGITDATEPHSYSFPRINTATNGDPDSSNTALMNSQNVNGGVMGTILSLTDFNLNDNMWKDFQQSELNELNNLYQNEFSGFKIID